jgi:hypothetical protein
MISLTKWFMSAWGSGSRCRKINGYGLLRLVCATSREFHRASMRVCPAGQGFFLLRAPGWLVM